MIKLQYFKNSDAPQLMQWVNTEELLVNWAGSLFSFPLTPASMEWYIEETNNLATSEAFNYKAINEKTGETVGHISLGGISRKNKAGRISRVLISEENKGKGYCKKMITEVLRIGFNDLNLHRISLGVYDINKAALKCYQSAGFTIEGTKRDVLRYKDEWWSLIEMSILEDEWQKLNV